MMSALEKAKALKEFRQLRAKFGVLVMSPLEKAKALKRFRELRGMLGGGDQPAVSQQSIDEKEPTLPQQQAKLLANFPALQTFVDAAKSKGMTNSGVDWNGAYSTIVIGGLGNSVDVAFNVVGKEKGKLIVKRWNMDAGQYDIIATFPADESSIQDALSAAEKYASDQSAKDNSAQEPAADTSLLDGIISGQIDTFKDKAKLQELSDSLQNAGGDDMPPGDLRDRFEQAIRAAGIQVLTGFGYLEAA